MKILHRTAHEHDTGREVYNLRCSIVEVDILKIHEIMCLTKKLNRSKPEKKGDNKVGSRTLK